MAKQPQSAPITACKGEGPVPVPVGAASSTAMSPKSPLIVVLMTAELSALTDLRRKMGAGLIDTVRGVGYIVMP